MKDRWRKLKRISSLAKEHTFLATCALCVLVCVLLCIGFLVHYLCTAYAYKLENKISVNENYTAVHFTDENFEIAVRHALGKPTGDIYAEDLQMMNTLSITNQLQLTDLSDIKLFPRLTNLTILGCSVFDITPISSLKYLENVNLSKNKIIDFSPLCSLGFLKTINLSFNNISQIPTQIQSLGNLTDLNISNNRVININSLINNNNLINLYIRGNKLTEVPDLGKMHSLTIADFGDNTISRIASLEDVVVLQKLNIDNNILSDISFLLNQKSLIYLDISNNDIGNISALQTCDNLETLALRGVHEFDLTPLQKITKFNSIYLDESFDRKNIDFMVGNFKTGDLETKRYLVTKKNTVESK
jgi:Leucine-rich repeat (LRR) protein